jgi:hypothetical protein
MASFGRKWQHLAENGIIWQKMALFSRKWQHLAENGNI